MKTLKTLALIGASALAVSAVSTAAAQAQPYGYGDGRYYQQDYRGYDRPVRDGRLTPAYLDRLDARVDAAARQHLMSWSQASDLARSLHVAKPWAEHAQSGYANRWEIQRLRATINRVEAATNRYAYNDRYDRYDWRR